MLSRSARKPYFLAVSQYTLPPEREIAIAHLSRGSTQVDHHQSQGEPLIHRRRVVSRRCLSLRLPAGMPADGVRSEGCRKASSILSESCGAQKMQVLECSGLGNPHVAPVRMAIVPFMWMEH